MSIRAKFFATFRELFEARERELPAAEAPTIGALIERLCDSPARRAALFDGAALKPHLIIMINGAPVPPSGFAEAPLCDGDVVSIFPLLGGG
ncbi:MAG: MoaD/ThiS family protein [Candidatus Aminicenantes bacterium]|nr:MoaD/ThiS family protein [Candidatus Aminicenantes bacterium]